MPAIHDWQPLEEAVALFYKSRKVHPERIGLIIKYFCDEQHTQQAINRRIASIRDHELFDHRPDLYYGVHDFDTDAVDDYLWRLVDEGWITEVQLLEVTLFPTELAEILDNHGMDVLHFEANQPPLSRRGW